MTNATTPIEAAFEMQRQSIKQTQQLLEQSLTLQQNTLEPFLHKDISAQHSTNFEQGAKLLQQLVNAQFDAAESRLTEDESRSAMNSQSSDFEVAQNQAQDEPEPGLVEAFNALSDQQKQVITQLIKTFLDTQQDIEQQTSQGVQQTEDAVQTTQQQPGETVQATEEAGETTAENGEDITSDSEGANTDVDVDKREGEELKSIDGIGETYANRLRSSGIESLGQLAQANSETVADVAEISEDRAKEWISSAQSQA